MKKSRFTDDQIALALKQGELGTCVEEFGRKMGISDAAFYVWRTKYAGHLQTRTVENKGITGAGNPAMGALVQP